MKDVKLKVPDHKLQFFMELAEQLGFEIEQEIEISEQQKAVVRERSSAYQKNPDRLIDWKVFQ